MRIPTGITDQYIYFVAVDSTDLVTRKTGLSSFTAYRSRNGGTATAYTTPTITEVSSGNMPGVYKFLLDEDMTIDAGDDSQEICYHITATGMAPVTRVIELYRTSVTQGQTLTVAASGQGLANVAAIGSGVITATSIATDAITAVKIADNALVANKFAANTIDKIVDAVWDEDPNAHTSYPSTGNWLNDINYKTGWMVVRTGTAQAGAAGTITLDAGASASSAYYLDNLIYIAGGTGFGQTRAIWAYNGTTKVASVSSNWITTPDNTSFFVILPASRAHVWRWANTSVPGFVNSRMPSYVGEVANDAITADSFAANTVAKVADGVWDEDMSGHSTGGSSGGLLNEVQHRRWAFIRQGVAQAGNTTTITLDSGASSTNDTYNGSTITIISGTGAEQARTIYDYVGSTKVAIMDSSWITAPDNTSIFNIFPGAAQVNMIGSSYPNPAIRFAIGLSANNMDTQLSGISSKTNLLPASPANTGDPMTLAAGSIGDTQLAPNSGIKAIRLNTAQAGNTTTITLDASASATTDAYKGSLITIVDGTGVGQSSQIIQGYNGSTKVATVSPGWTTSPNNTSVYAIIPHGRTEVRMLAGNPVSQTSGRLDVNVDYWKGTTAPAMTGDSFARLGAPAGASVSADVAAIAAKTDKLPANTAGSFAAIETKVDTVDTVVDAVKVKTDSLTFTETGHVDANIKRVNDVEVTGVGSVVDPWGPVP